nr:hypothetical protein Iba_chr05fCG14340 [Ipomoea batatas]
MSGFMDSALTATIRRRGNDYKKLVPIVKSLRLDIIWVLVVPICLRKVSSSKGAIHPSPPSSVPNNKAKRFVLSETGAALARSGEFGSNCNRKNLEIRAPTWNSALDSSFCPFQLSDIFGA